MTRLTRLLPIALTALLAACAARPGLRPAGSAALGLGVCLPACFMGGYDLLRSGSDSAVKSNSSSRSALTPATARWVAITRTLSPSACRKCNAPPACSASAP